MLTWIDEIASPNYYLREAVAYCSQTGAVLHRTRKQWVLHVGYGTDDHQSRSWQRAKVSEQEILQHAQNALDTIKNTTSVRS